MMDWSEHEEEHVQETRAHWLSLLWRIACCACLGVILALAVREARADPLFSTVTEGATITLTNEPCIVKEIANLPYRATWVEKDKTYEGCYGVRTDIGVVIAYFNDRTVALIPVQAFTRVVGA